MSVSLNPSLDGIGQIIQIMLFQCPVQKRKKTKIQVSLASLVVLLIKNPPAMKEISV